MNRFFARRVSAALVAAAILAAACVAQAAELRVFVPNAVKDAALAIAARFERDSGHRAVFVWTGSEAIARRIGEGEAFDVVVNTAAFVDRLVTDGRIAASSKRDFARSSIAAAAMPGTPPPDVSSMDGLRRALREAKSIAISSGASGRHLEQLFVTLGVADEIKGKLLQPPSGAQISDLLRRGEAELGFQQVSELVHAQGIQYLGKLPEAAQGHTIWSVAIHAATSETQAALALVEALCDPRSAAALRAGGLEPPP